MLYKLDLTRIPKTETYYHEIFVCTFLYFSHIKPLSVVITLKPETDRPSLTGALMNNALILIGIKKFETKKVENIVIFLI